MSPEPVQWNPSFETGLQFIDQEHAALLEQLNVLIDLLVREVPTSQWLPELDRLIAAVGEHFAHEERIMDNIGYPGYHTHHQQHQHLLQEVAEFRDGIAATAPEDTLATVRFLKFWVLKHMVQEDSKIGQHIHRGLKEFPLNPTHGGQQ